MVEVKKKKKKHKDEKWKAKYDSRGYIYQNKTGRQPNQKPQTMTGVEFLCKILVNFHTLAWFTHSPGRGKTLQQVIKASVILRILKDNIHLSYSLLTLLPSDKRYRSIRCRCFIPIPNTTACILSYKSTLTSKFRKSFCLKEQFGFISFLCWQQMDIISHRADVAVGRRRGIRWQK